MGRRICLLQGWEISGPRATCGPPKHFQWPAEGFRKQRQIWTCLQLITVCVGAVRLTSTRLASIREATPSNKHSEFGHEIAQEERRKNVAGCGKKAREPAGSIYETIAKLQNITTEASFMVACHRNNKPFSDGEFSEQCLVGCVSVLRAEMKSRFDTISLSKRLRRAAYRN